MIIFAVGKLDLDSQTPLTLTLTSELEVYIVQQILYNWYWVLNRDVQTAALNLLVYRVAMLRPYHWQMWLR